MMLLAEQVNSLVHSVTETPEVPMLAEKATKARIEAVPLKVSVGEDELKRLRHAWCEGGHVSLSFPSSLDLRDELVAEVKGLQAIETQHTMALVLPFDTDTEVPALETLRVTLEGPEFAALVAQITGAQLSGVSCALVAVPPGGWGGALNGGINGGINQHGFGSISTINNGL